MTSITSVKGVSRHEYIQWAQEMQYTEHIRHVAFVLFNSLLNRHL